MTEAPKSSQAAPASKKPATEKEQRLAAALKANIERRKAAAKRKPHSA